MSARQIIESRLKQVMDAKIKIRNGVGARNGDMPADKAICIMEATTYILGYDTISDNPPCTSRVIKQLMVELNDSCTNSRKRAQLKKVIPDIVNTAPIKPNPKYPNVLETDYHNPEYRSAERERFRMREDLEVSLHCYIDELWDKMKTADLLDFIRKLANVKHFS